MKKSIITLTAIIMLSLTGLSNAMAGTLEIIVKYNIKPEEVMARIYLPGGGYYGNGWWEGLCPSANIVDMGYTFACDLGNRSGNLSKTGAYVLVSMVEEYQSKWTTDQGALPTGNIVTPHFPGDLSNSNLVGLEDAILGLQTLVGIPVDVDLEADVNGDGRIGIEEVIYVLQVTAELR